MTIQDLGSLGELIAAIATVATLAYLAVQIRQSAKVARAQLAKDILLASRSALLEIAANEQLAEIAAESFVSTVDTNAIGPEEVMAVRKAEFFNSFFRLYELYFNLYRQGLLDEHMENSYDKVIGLFAKSETFLQWWRRAQVTEYHGKFADHVDAIIEKTNDST